MNAQDSLRILPEIILTITGVLVMLIDASLPDGWPRRPLGWVAAIGTTRGAVVEPVATQPAGRDRASTARSKPARSPCSSTC